MQLMPFADGGSDCKALRKTVQKYHIRYQPSGAGPYTGEAFLETVSGRFWTWRSHDTLPTQFHCNCSQRACGEGADQHWKKRAQRDDPGRQGPSR